MTLTELQERYQRFLSLAGNSRKAQKEYFDCKRRGYNIQSQLQAAKAAEAALDSHVTTDLERLNLVAVWTDDCKELKQKYTSLLALARKLHTTQMAAFAAMRRQQYGDATISQAKALEKEFDKQLLTAATRHMAQQTFLF